MSLIYIIDHNEVIYDVIETRKKAIKKSPRYISHLDTELLKNVQKEKQAYGTMGPPTYPPPKPSEFLRKQPKKVHKGKPAPFTRQCMCEKRAPVPEAKIEKKEQERKNFIKKNVLLAKKLKPPEIAPKFVDTSTGTVQQFKHSGLEPEHVYSKGFGKPPYYITDRVQNAKRFVQITKDKDEQKTFSKCRYISRPERQKLLDGLKSNWANMQREYQLLPIITDTTTKKLKKAKMEKEIGALEKDIVLIEKHPYIYVLDED